MTLSEAVRIARQTLWDAPGFNGERSDAYAILAKYHGKIDNMEHFADTYLEKENK